MSDDDLGGFKRPEPAPYEPATAAVINTPDFNPFAALGLDPATATPATIRPAFIRAMRHRHESAIARFPATATNFPSQVQVQQAYEYLSSSAARIATATIRWGHRHQVVFNPQHDVGSDLVFPTAATAATATPNRPTPAATAAAAAAASGSSYHPSPASSSSPPRKARRTAATGSGSTPGTAAGSGSDSGPGSAENPFPLSSEDEDDDDKTPATPTPAPRSRPYAASYGSGLAATGPAAPATAAPATATVGNPRPPPRNARAPTQRSGGSAHRNSSIPNPITNERITVGTWANATGATPNAVVAGFDARGRMFYRIVNADLQGNPVTAPTATATRFEDINFRAPYQNMTATQLRTIVDQHLRLSFVMRP